MHIDGPHHTISAILTLIAFHTYQLGSVNKNYCNQFYSHVPTVFAMVSCFYSICQDLKKETNLFYVFNARYCLWLVWENSAALFDHC